jgi:glycosyltransferase involved in cell wall biosynthesis
MPEEYRLDLSFVIITWNDAGRLPLCLASAALAARTSGLDYEILVVDNGSRDHTRKVLEAFAEVLGGRLRVLYLERNTGTTFSRNRALEMSRGRLLCVLDSDAEILDPDLGPVARLLGDFPEVGIVGPAIIMPDGSTYNSVKRLPTLTDKLLKLPGILLRRPTINHDWYPDFPFRHTRCVQTAISCCWFLRRDTWQRLGPLDERIFYAPEDVDYCLRSWKAGRAVVFFPHLKVKHHTRQLTHKKPFSATSRSHLKGLLYYLHKHRYWLGRERLVEASIRPLARVLDLRLARWEAAP